MEQKIDQVMEMECAQSQETNAPVTASNLFAKIRNIALSICALVFVTVMFYSASSTWSVYTDGVNSGKNTIVAGSLDMEIIEMNSQGEVELPFADPIRIVPSLKVSKIVRIKNTGTLPIYVRVKIDISIDKDESTLPENWRSLISCNFNLGNEENGNAGTWELREDGYYYYILPLEASKVTTQLFDTITFLPEMGNEFTNSKIEFTVTCQAIQLEAGVWPTLDENVNDGDDGEGEIEGNGDDAEAEIENAEEPEVDEDENEEVEETEAEDVVESDTANE